MFVKQITEVELNEYERALEGTISSVGLLTADDDATHTLIRSVLSSCKALQKAIRAQIEGHQEEPTVPAHVPAPVED